jgi:sulfur relay (sulfurtransferase) complex TusBCD TusD component (DsrE family)
MAAATPPIPVKKIVVVEDSLLAQMASDPRFTQQFPFLQAVKPVSAQKRPTVRSCGGCAGRRGVQNQPTAASQAKVSLANMNDAQKQKLKELLGTQQVRVTYRSGNRIVEHIF